MVNGLFLYQPCPDSWRIVIPQLWFRSSAQISKVFRQNLQDSRLNTPSERSCAILPSAPLNQAPYGLFLLVLPVHWGYTPDGLLSQQARSLINCDLVGTAVLSHLLFPF